MAPSQNLTAANELAKHEFNYPTRAPNTVVRELRC